MVCENFIMNCKNLNTSQIHKTLKKKKFFQNITKQIKGQYAVSFISIKWITQHISSCWNRPLCGPTTRFASHRGLVS